jgi:hypothetical protein
MSSFIVGSWLAYCRSVHSGSRRRTNCSLYSRTTSKMDSSSRTFKNWCNSLRRVNTVKLLNDSIHDETDVNIFLFILLRAQFGTIISMPISGLLAEKSWPSIFYVFGFMGVIWSLAFLWTVHEDPQSSPKVSIQLNT